jgi:hypothetical protein
VSDAARERKSHDSAVPTAADIQELRRRCEGKAFPLKRETCLSLLDEIERLREATASAMTSLATGPLKDGYAYHVLKEAVDGDA